jgi:hypothetical protein
VGGRWTAHRLTRRSSSPYRHRRSRSEVHAAVRSASSESLPPPPSHPSSCLSCRPAIYANRNHIECVSAIDVNGSVELRFTVRSKMFNIDKHWIKTGAAFRRSERNDKGDPYFFGTQRRYRCLRFSCGLKQFCGVVCGAITLVNGDRGRLHPGDPLGEGTYRTLFVSRFWRENSKSQKISPIRGGKAFFAEGLFYPVLVRSSTREGGGRNSSDVASYTSSQSNVNIAVWQSFQCAMTLDRCYPMISGLTTCPIASRMGDAALHTPDAWEELGAVQQAINRARGDLRISVNRRSVEGRRA